jgi:hypothetical protein
MTSSLPVVIPDQLKGRGLRFTRLRPPILGDKNSGKGPVDPGFYDDGALAEDDDSLLSYIKAGGGFGLVGTYGDFIGFDADEGEELEALGIMARLPRTLTDRAPHKPESLHLYYICPGLPKTFHFYHPTKTVEKAEKDGEGGEGKQLVRLELGQICAGRGHITGPGAPHWSGGRREIIDDSPLAEITVDDLRAILRGLAFSDDPTKNPTFETAAGLEEKAGRWDALEEITRKARRGRRGDGPSLSERIGDIRRVLDTYGWSPTTKSGDNWKGDIPGEVSKSKTALAVDIKKGVWYCHHHADSGGDAAALVALFEGLIDCRGKDHLRDRVVFQAVIKACEEKGLIDPDEDRGRGEISAAEARDLLETLEEKLSEDPDGWAQDPDVKRVLASYRRRDAVGAEALLKRAGVRGDLKKALLTDLKRIDDEDGDDEKGDRGPSMATRIVDLALASGALFWKSPEGEPFATIPNGGGHIENHPLRSKAAKTWLSGLLYEAEGRAPKGSAVMDALAVLEGRAIFEGETFPVFVRLAESGDKFYLDLGGEDWRAVEIDSRGWRVISSEAVPVKFRRSKGFMELPEPKRGGDLEDLRRVLNVPEGAPWVLVRAWLVQAFKPAGPYPPLIVDGEQGSGKSWLGRILRAVVDPNKSPLRRPPRNEHEMMIAGANSWLQNYDNLSGLPPWLGDAICVMSTGGGMSIRALYTDGEEALFDIQRPVILNGIDALTTRGDLLDRAILLHLPRIEDKDRMTEKEILAEVERIRPGVLGAILDVISHGLKELPHVKLDSMPRMADFAEWVVACEQAPGWKPGEFLEAFAENQRESKVALIENDMFAVSLVKFINGPEEPAVFENTAGFLLSVLEERSGITSSNRPDGWPRTAKGAANKIRRLVPALRSVGIEVAFKTGHGHVRLIRIERHTATKKDVPPPTATKKTASRGDGGGGGGYSLTLTLNEKKREGEREEREKREGKDRKLSPPRPPQPQHNGFCGGDGGDRGAVVGESERTKTPPPKGDEEGRVFGLTHAYYRDLQRQTGGLSIKVLMDNQGWDRERADIAMGLLRKAGVVG